MGDSTLDQFAETGESWSASWDSACGFKKEEFDKRHPKETNASNNFPKVTLGCAVTTTLGSAGCFIGQAFTTGAAQDWFLGTGIGLAVASVVLWSIFTYQCANGRCCNKV